VTTDLRSVVFQSRPTIDKKDPAHEVRRIPLDLNVARSDTPPTKVGGFSFLRQLWLSQTTISHTQRFQEVQQILSLVRKRVVRL
jgi:hypothetical protein